MLLNIESFTVFFTTSSRGIKMNVIDLFAGAGGLGIGATLAGGQVCLSVELDQHACETLTKNQEQHPAGVVLQSDVSQISGDELRVRAQLHKNDPLLVIGGAPCQPFSKAAYWTDSGDDARYRRSRSRGEVAAKPDPVFTAKDDDRRDLVYEFTRLVFETDADGFIFENVPSILHPRNKHIVPSIIDAAQNAGYFCTFFKLNSFDFGVAQKRERVFIVGSKAATVKVPQPTHGFSKPGEEKLLSPHVTAGEALAGLEADTYFEPEEIVKGRYSEHLREVPPGWNYKALTAWAGHPSPSFEAETRFWNFLLKLTPEKPSWTIAATPGPWTGPFHWDSRRLRTSEMAALQSFPRGYHFTGSRRERVRQIGNAVPPLLAKAVVDTLKESFCSNEAYSAVA
jgi:DNA (cytosine-5)-methyltransferase 1